MLAEEIRQLPSGRDLPLIFLTCVRLRGDDPRPTALGITNYTKRG